jgi:hypothetical protein
LGYELTPYLGLIWSVFYDLSIFENYMPPRKGSDVRFMGYYDHRDPVVTIQLPKDPHYFKTGPGIKISRGLIGQDNGRAIDESPGDCYPLLLAAGQLVGMVVFVPGKTHDFQGLKGFHATFLCRNVAVDKGEFYVFQGRGATQKVKPLEDKTYPAIANGGQLLHGKVADVFPFQEVLTVCGPIQAPQYIHEG